MVLVFIFPVLFMGGLILLLVGIFKKNEVRKCKSDLAY